MTPLPLHTTIEGYGTRAGEVTMDGHALGDLVRRAGRTPFYAYSRGIMDARLRRLRTALPGDVRLHYSVKANPLPELVRHVAAGVDGLDVASAGELAVALATGMAPDRVSFAGPGKLPTEHAAAIAAGVCVNVESPSELERLAVLGNRSGVRPRVAIRVNPAFELRSSGMRMGGGPRPFGIDAEQVPDVLRRCADLDVDFTGLQIFAGSQSLDGAAIAAAQTEALELALRLAEHAPCPPRTVNLGGGFGIPYFPGDRPLDLGPVGAALAAAGRRLAAALPPASLVIELGRYIVGEAGVYVCRVVDRKVSRGQVFLVADGGLNHHLAATGNLGQVLRRNFPVLVGNRLDSGPTETASVVGPLCTPLDLLADRMELARAEPGDLLVVFQSGAYGATASPQGFLGHPAPAEILV